MKRTIAIILAFVLCLSLFAACGKSKGGEKTPSDNQGATNQQTENSDSLHGGELSTALIAQSGNPSFFP